MKSDMKPGIAADPMKPMSDMAPGMPMDKKSNINPEMAPGTKSGPGMAPDAMKDQMKPAAGAADMKPMMEGKP